MRKGRDNFKIIHDKIYSDPRYKGQFKIFEPAEGCDPAWFGLACLLDAPSSLVAGAVTSVPCRDACNWAPVVDGVLVKGRTIEVARAEHARPSRVGARGGQGVVRVRAPAACAVVPRRGAARERRAERAARR